MEKIVLGKDIAKAILSFRSTDRNRQALHNVRVLGDKSIVATDGKRLILITRAGHGNDSLTEGVYKVLSTGKDSTYMSFICWEKVEDQFPDIYQVLKSTDTLKMDGKDIFFDWNGENFSLMRALYNIFHLFGMMFNPDLFKDLPKTGYRIHGDPGKKDGAIECESSVDGSVSVRALFMPIRTTDR